MSEMITFANATTTTTDTAITMDGSNFAVTANAEQIPNICTTTGFFLLNGASNISLFFAENKFMTARLFCF
jgi:hypothetical protein